MAEISVNLNETSSGWKATVSVVEGGTSQFIVTLDKGYYQQITAGEHTPEELIRASFEFLLDREPKESILSQFDLPVINRYFPEYEQKIENYL